MTRPVRPTPLTRLARRVRRLHVDRLRLGARIRDLEAEVQENRQLNRRIAELTDVVAELLVPIHDRDDARVREVLERYRAGV